MATRIKAEIAATVLVLLLAAIGLHAYISEREDRIRAEVTVQAQQSVQKQLGQQISDLQKQIADRDAEYKADKKAQDTKFQQAASPQQIASLVAQLMGLKQPIQIVQPLPTATNPNPAPIAQVSTLDAPAVKSYLEQCETCKLQLPKLQLDLADRQKQAELAQQQIESLKKENSSLQTAVKGGTVIQRTLRTVKWLAIGAVAGYVAGHRF